MTDPIVFALNATREFGLRVAREIRLPLAEHEEREFDDGEHKARPRVNVRNRDVYVIQSLYGEDRQSVNDKLCRLLFFLGALRDAAAARVTAVLPYLCYARKDIRTQTRDPVTTRYVATLLEAVGVQCVVTLDVHNLGAYQNAFRCGTEHLHTAGLFAAHIAPMIPRDGAVCVVSPDAGGVKRAERLRQRLMRELAREVPLAVMEKARGRGVLTPGRLIGEVGDGLAIVVDDMIGTGGTLAYAARACRAHGARRVLAVAAHGLFVGNAATVIGGEALDQVLVTDTVPPFRLPPDLLAAKVSVVSVVPLFAAAIRRMHDGGSLVELLGD